MFILAIGLMPFNSSAKLVITTQIAIGEIIEIQDKTIELENGSLYYPTRKDTALSFQSGDIITIKFYKNPEGKNYYIEVALGENTLSASPPPKQKKRKSVY